MEVNINKLTNPNKVLNVLLERMLGSIDKTSPISVEIHPTNICNFNCSYCSYAIRKSNRQSINPTKLMSLCESLVDMGVQSITFAGGGDPTMYPELKNIIDYLYSKNVSISLLTNGSNINLLRKIAHKCEYILIHIASYKGDIYKRLMGKDLNMEILRLPDIIKHENEKAPLIGARIVVVDENLDTLKLTVEKLLEMEFDYIQCTPGTDYEMRGIGVDKNKLLEIFNDPIFNNPKVMKAIKYSSNNCNSSPRCASIENLLHAVVDAVGGVYICPPYTSNPNLCIGNINSASFKDIWNGKRHQQVIEYMNKHYSENKCNNCRFIGYNRVIEDFEEARKNPHSVFI